jgi:hypothetical protein
MQRSMANIEKKKYQSVEMEPEMLFKKAVSTEKLSMPMDSINQTFRSKESSNQDIEAVMNVNLNDIFKGDGPLNDSRTQSTLRDENQMT